MIKIAFACNQEGVCPHFGFCEYFQIADIDQGRVVHQYVLQNPGHRPGFLPLFLHANNVQLIVAGGMGTSAIDLFAKHGIEVILSNKRSVDDLLDDYLTGKLQSSRTACATHDHPDES